MPSNIKAILRNIAIANFASLENGSRISSQLLSQSKVKANEKQISCDSRAGIFPALALATSLLANFNVLLSLSVVIGYNCHNSGFGFMPITLKKKSKTKQSKQLNARSEIISCTTHFHQ